MMTDKPVYFAHHTIPHNLKVKYIMLRHLAAAGHYKTFTKSLCVTGVDFCERDLGKFVCAVTTIE